MTTTAKMPVSIYTESTPNPETMRFVTDKMLLLNISADFTDEGNTKEAPLAAELFGFPFVQGVFIMNNFVTVTKQQDTDWQEIAPILKEFIADYISEGRSVFTNKFKPALTHLPSDTTDTSPVSSETEVINKIKEIFENQIKPAIARDGGAIQFKSYNKGKVAVKLHGACNGCPSSTITLKAGIERILRKEIPEVEQVVAE